MNTEPEQEDPASESAEGDYVPYGFGHPAHKPDPNARYGFEPGETRLLPVEPSRRWKVPG